MKVQSQTETTGALRQVLSVGAHTLHADVAEALGGASTAPGPHEYFDLSLAACKALTAHVVARSRGWALERVEVEVERDDSQERQGKYGLRVQLRFLGALSDEEKHKLYDLVGRCPIHKLMTTAEVTIETAPLEP